MINDGLKRERQTDREIPLFYKVIQDTRAVVTLITELQSKVLKKEGQQYGIRPGTVKF